MLPAGFEPTIPASERLQIHALDRAATGIGFLMNPRGTLNYKSVQVGLMRRGYKLEFNSISDKTY